MKKSELLRAIQNEIQRHNLSTFRNDQHGVTEVGCSTCNKRFGTNQQFVQHINEDVLPPLLDRLSSEGRNNQPARMGYRV
jgi:hypothetical protein